MRFTIFGKICEMWLDWLMIAVTAHERLICEPAFMSRAFSPKQAAAPAPMCLLLIRQCRWIERQGHCPFWRGRLLTVRNIPACQPVGQSSAS